MESLQNFFFFQIKDHEAQIEELETEIKTDQNKWLRLQYNIVSMSEKLTQILNVSNLARQRTIHSYDNFFFFFTRNDFVSIQTDFYINIQLQRSWWLSKKR